MNLHMLGKVGVVVAHVAPPFSRGYNGMSDQEVVTEITQLMQRMFGCSRTYTAQESIVTR